ncbi:MAG: hypothetical protein LBI44_02705 [Oscillospiraceae bacterium]|jgi:hypothetical protein|nr:hypothetical protein [Oscillospiraceae bacterium]
MKKYLTRPMCLLVSLVVLAGAVAAAAFTGSPYDTLKKAAIDTLFAETYTMTTRVRLYADGELFQDSGEQYKQYGATGFVEINDGWVNYRKYGEEGMSGISLDTAVPAGKSEDGRQWYLVSRHNSFYLNSFYPQNVYGPFSAPPFERDGLAFRFADLALDAAVGDLKHNLVISGGGTKTVSGTLTAAQIPELYNAGLSLLLASQSGYSRYVNDFDYRVGDSYVWEETILDGKVKTVRVWEEKWTERVYTHPDGTEEIFSDHSKNLLSERKGEAVPADYGDVKTDHPMESAKIDFVSGTAVIGEDGYIASLTGTLRLKLVTIFGETAEVEVIADAAFERVNSTVVTSPIPGLEELFTEEYMTAHFESYREQMRETAERQRLALLEDYKPDGEYFDEYYDMVLKDSELYFKEYYGMYDYDFSSPVYGYYYALYFALNEDGTVDESSISPEYKGGVYDDIIYDTKTDIIYDTKTTKGALSGRSPMGRAEAKPAPTAADF